MKKHLRPIVTLALTLSLCLFMTATCGALYAAKASAASATTDQEAADHVAALIDAIYVQERTDQTDAQCAEAKAAWDALTDAQKELVAGEFADPDYFGRDILRRRWLGECSWGAIWTMFLL